MPVITLGRGSYNFDWAYKRESYIREGRGAFLNFQGKRELV